MAVTTSTHIPVAAPSPAVVWQQYRRTGDQRARDRLVFTLAPLVRHAGATTPEQAEAGLTALLIAVETYSPAQDGPIESFAWAEIRAALGA
jgi:DNA-directed RNA polymerase specialized sigma subunit